MVECSFFITNCWYTFSNKYGIEKPHNFYTKIFNFVQFNHKNHCCNLSLNIMIKWWKYSMANILNGCVSFSFFFFFFFSNLEAVEKIIWKPLTSMYWWIVPIKKIRKSYKGSNHSLVRKIEYLVISQIKVFHLEEIL